ncbi:MAG: hypothetical protein JO273_00635 [Methylobacteriaceae bacterium]|nr:hypothetical protein [Methylobacteriaceae bacterium]
MKSIYIEPDDIQVEIVEVEGDLMVAVVSTAVAVIEIVARVKLADRVLWIQDAHVQGASPGAVGRRGLNAIGRKLMQEADADQIIIEGSARTTGSNPGRKPWAIHFPSRSLAGDRRKNRTPG